MRPLDKVIEAVLKLVPQDFPKKEILEKDCQVIKDNYASSEPASIHHLWFFFAQTLNAALGEPDQAWKNDIIDLMSGKKDYQEVLDA